MPPTFTNRLSKESSPYLRQHAHNPVDWYPWGNEAISLAKQKDLPILVSIGYSACHWCHVMEHESFEDEEVADYMNTHFINIKIDREERPDLDHIYMDAVQAIAGSGGWPLNVFLTPDTKPFYGGTYFPPRKAYNRASWKDILAFISDSWKNKREELVKQADILVAHIQSSGNQLLKAQPLAPDSDGLKFSAEDCKDISKNILKSADLALGGFGAAPKFPQTFTLQYLLMFGHFFKDDKSTQHALYSLKQMLNGGIYDHLAGGMARYSTDSKWLAPHFEKMLYDNALLVNVLTDAYQITQDGFFRDGIDKTLGFLIREMKHPEGGFYAALDADTEGVEGKYYVWDKKEIEEVLQEEASLACEWYGVTEEGNWEEKNILHIHTDLQQFAKERSLDEKVLNDQRTSWNHKLLNRRITRTHPSIDDKILIGWNALLLTSFCKASAALNSIDYKEEAIALYDFIIARYKNEAGGFYHTYKNGKATQPAFLDDYACLVQACLSLQEITSQTRYLLQAKEITLYVIEHFEDAETGMFSFTHIEQEDVLVRKTEIYDGAVPSGNSIMADNLVYLSRIFNEPGWMEKANRMLQQVKEITIKYPTSFGIWGTIILKQFIGIHEIVITGSDVKSTVEEFMQQYIPNKVFQWGEVPGNFTLMQDKDFQEKVWIYLCKEYACSLPVRSVNELQKHLFNEYLNINLHNI